MSADEDTATEELAAPEEAAQTPAPSAPVWASSDDLGDDTGTQDVLLPTLNRMVRVRRLTTPEVTRLTRLPDLFNFRELIQKLTEAQAAAEAKQNGNRATRRKTKEEPAVDEGELEAENYRYQAHVAHLAVLRYDPNDPEPLAEATCGDCGWVHQPSLWSFERCLRLMPADVSTITAIALGTREAEAIGPFSEETTPSASPSPATTGE